MLVAGDVRRRGRSMLMKELTGGRHWARLVRRFGVGVAIVLPGLLGFRSQG
jgi:hypothetical protein